jgi:signal transduction histidine kinase
MGPGRRHFDRSDLALLEELAQRAALAIDNAHLYAAERAARESAERATARALRLQSATAALSVALTSEDVTRVAVDVCMATVGAVGGAITLIRPSDQLLEMGYCVGYPDEVIAQRLLLPLDHPTPRAVVARTGEPLWLDSPAEAQLRYPDTVLSSVIAHGQCSWAIVPLIVGGRVLGSLLFSFDRTHALDEGDRASLLALAGLSAQAIERARLFEAEQSNSSRLQQILGVLPEAVLGVDAEGNFAFANGAAVAVLGFDPVGQPLPLADQDAYQIFGARRSDGSPYPDRDLPLERAVLLGEITRGEQLILRNAATGADVPVLVSAAPLRDGSGAIAGGIAAFQDITAFKVLERVRDDFYAAVSHDLKNPLTIIRAHTQLVQRQLGKLDPAIAAPLIERLDIAVSATGRMNQLLGDLLDHARLQTGEPLDLTPEPTDLVALLHRLAAQWERLSDRHEFVVETFTEALTITVDPRRFERVVENLLSNAVKYSPAGGKVFLAVSHEQLGGIDWVTVAVRDSGLGVPAADLSHIFEPYQRGGNVRGRIDGSGLGLANARRLIEQHGGTIALASIEGQGTTVTIRLPWQ